MSGRICKMTVGEIIAGLSHFPLDKEIVITSPNTAESDFDVEVDVVEGRPNCIHMVVKPV